MSVRRVMGIETEYGIRPVHAGEHDPETLSRRLIRGYGSACGRLGMPDDVAWDLSADAPLHDPRSSVIPPPEPHTHPVMGLLGTGAPTRLVELSRLEREWQRGTTKVLHNGARLYVDHAHPEYAAPEALGPLEALRYDLAGEAVLRRAMEECAQDPSGSIVHKNNVDGKGAAYGCHENYLVDRRVGQDVLTAALAPFLVTRPVLVGAGRVGLGRWSESPGFQMSQRADYVEQVQGRHTTYRRPIVNTRDEPHADPYAWRRVHVIGGDANCLPAATLLKLGMTALVLGVLESEGLPPEWERLALADPVGEFRRVSRDLTLGHRLTTQDGRGLTALEVQRVYLDVVTDRLAGSPTDPETADVLGRWRRTLTALESGWQAAVGTVEWATKHALIGARLARDDLGWDAPEAMAMDLQWSDLRPGHSLSGRLRASGHVEPLVAAADVETTEFTPPATTRAWVRGELIRRFPREVYAASWHSVVVEPPSGGMVRIPLTDPLGGTLARLGPILDTVRDLDALVDLLTTPAD